MWGCATPATWNQGGCHQVPRLPRRSGATQKWRGVTGVTAAPKPVQARHPMPSVPRRPRKTTVDVRLCHACHVKSRWMSPSATPATQKWRGVPWRLWRRATSAWRHFCVAGVALGDIHLDFTWQAWHNLTSTVVLRGRRGTDGTGWRAWTGLGAAVTPVTPRHFCVAGVALGDIHLDFTWQAWHNLTSTVVLRGRRGTDGIGWRAWTGLGAAVTPVTPRHFCVAGVALGDIHLDFTWQAWHNLTSTVVLRGRRGTDGTGWRAWTGLGAAVTPVTPRHFCVAGVALGDVHLDYMQGRFAWQAPHWWHLVTYTLISRGTRCGTISRPWRQQLIMTIYQVWLPATGHAERVRKICGFARKSAEHYFGQRKYGEHTIALIEGSAIKDLSGSNVGKKTIRAWWSSKKASETRRET